MLLYRILLFALLLPAQSLAARDVPDAAALLSKMSNALKHLNYDGVFIYKQGRSMSTLRIIHKSDSDGEQERLVSLSGYPREVLRNKKSVTCIFPDNKSVMVEKSRAGEMLQKHVPGSFSNLSENYAISVSGEGRIADHDAWVVNVKPRDQYRYGYLFWIDKDTSLLLKSSLRNMSGQPLEELVFTRLDVLDEIPAERLQAGMSTRNFTWKHSTERIAARQDSANPWLIAWMPQGFNVSSYEKQPLTAESYSEHIVLTDGIAVVSVFIEKIESSSDIIQGPARVGGVNAFARFANGYTVTAIGEVPQSTVQRMANSVVSLY